MVPGASSRLPAGGPGSGPLNARRVAANLARHVLRLTVGLARVAAGTMLATAHRARNQAVALPRRVADVGRRTLTSGLRLRQHEGRPLRLPDRYVRTQPPHDPPVISIVTPSFNQGGFVERTLRSVLEQQYERLQYIVQDGGSTDGTRGLLERHGNRLHHWESAPDAGQAAAINAGFRHSSGNVLAWLNADDVLLPGSLAYVARFFGSHPKVDVIYSHRILLDAQDREIGRWVLPRHDDRTLRWADYVPQETLFWRRRVWERVGGSVDERYEFAIDWDLLLRFQKAGARFARVPRFLAAFRIHDEQKTAARLADVGTREMQVIREWVHGRAVSSEEVQRAIGMFVLRHAVYRTLYRTGVFRY